MKKIIAKIFIVCIVLSSIFFVGKTYADNNVELEIKEAEYTERYEEWLKLSDEDKKKVTEPRKYNVITSKDNESYLKSNNNIFKTYQLLKASVADKSYNLKNDIPENVKIRNQQKTNSCWTFAMTGVLESHLGLEDKQNSKSIVEYDFSESHMDYSSIRSGVFLSNNINKFGYTRKLSDGGTYAMATQYLSNGLGAVNEEDFPFIERDDSINEIKTIDIAEISNQDVQTTLYDTVVFDENDTDIKTKMKQHIMNYGGLFAMIHGADIFTGDYYNNNTGAMYCNNSTEEPVDHAVTIIGWDDEYAIENFNEKQRPTSKGAWIIKNSWGEYQYEDLEATRQEIYNALASTNNWTSIDEVTNEVVLQYSKLVFGENKVKIEGNQIVVEMGNEGYMYVSYEDCNVYSGLMGIEKAKYSKDYDNVYQNDELGPNGNMTANTNKIYLANVFTRDSSVEEILDKVSIYTFQEYTNCKVYVNPNSDSKALSDLQEIKLKEGDTVNVEPGYHVLEFAEPIALKGDSFVVVLQIETNGNNTQFAIEYKASSPSWYENVVVNKGESFVAAELTTGQWKELAELDPKYEGNVCIKAYTTLGEIEPENPEQPTTPTSSDFSNAKSEVTEAKVNFDTSNLENSTAEITIKISGIKIGDESNTYTYYYHLSGTQGDENITDWKETKIQKENDGTYSIILNIDSNELANINQISDSENLYVYIKEIAKVDEEVVENIVTLKTEFEIEPVFYVDGQLIGGVEDILNYGSNVQDNTDDTVSSKILPSAGSTTLKILIILVIIIFGSFAFYRYKNIDK